MITLKSKYFISKMLWGILFVVSGIIKLWVAGSSNTSIRIASDVVAWGVFLVVLATEFYAEKKKVEPMDELAVLNQLKAKSSIYNGIFVLMVIYLLFGSAFTLSINSGVAFLILGVFQILEFLLFDVYEKKELKSFE